MANPVLLRSSASATKVLVVDIGTSLSVKRVAMYLLMDVDGGGA